jgi:hypothetical protein
LPKDDAGRYVPWFVAWPNNKPDFRVVNAPKLLIAYKERLCWVCGERLGKHLAFVLGPMCAINRVNGEPPSHLECAQFSVRACPFLSTPRMHRRERDLPQDAAQPAGIALARNPGAMAIWVTASYMPFKAGNGILFRLGDPEKVLWYCEGREATRAEVMASIESGLPILQKMADEDGREAQQHLQEDYQRALKLLLA